MTDLVVINGQNVEFEVANDQVTTTSFKIASVFNKRHGDIIRKIELMPDDEFRQLNFEPSFKPLQNGLFEKDTKYYKITRDGFVMLVMGFTGEKAYRFKIDYINAFNKMEQMLKNKELESSNKPISNLERRNKRVALGYKSQLAQQKEKYELQIKSLKCELEHGQKIDFKKGIDKDLKRQLAERGYLLMNLADFHSLGEGLTARMFEGLG